ncbi:MAG: 1-acyl-sn-glycerol-3-phosphate acyltransferase [Flavobacteriaceae bacterium]|nr:1-acyl-sn-glycerol-3-phosphate acyltransferase [Flavobacteriaceae bacterium]
MRKLLAYPLTVIYFLFFGLALLVFHPIQWLCLNLLGYNAHTKSVSLLNLCLMGSTLFLGTRYRFKKAEELPTDRPLILVSNHQSMNDIPPLIWYMRKYHPKFVSKKELGKGIPSVSYNLRHGGSVLIDRKNKEQSLNEIKKLGQYIEKFNRSAVIFPEGTRSRDGITKKFHTGGLKALMSTAPSALLVPISINNSWKLLRYGKFPYGIGTFISIDVHAPIPNSSEVNKILEEVETKVKSEIRT